MVFRGICLLYLLAIFQTTYLHCRRTITDNERKENKSLMTANDVITQRKNADSFCYVTAFCLYHRNFNMTILSLLRPHRVHIRKQQELFFFCCCYHYLVPSKIELLLSENYISTKRQCPLLFQCFL